MCTDGLPYERAYFGQGSGAVAIDEVVCKGDEPMLINCTYRPPRYDYHNEDAGVRCFASPGLCVLCAWLVLAMNDFYE